GSLIPPHEYHAIRNPQDEAVAVSLHVYQHPLLRCHVFVPADEASGVAGWTRREERRLCTDATASPPPRPPYCAPAPTWRNGRRRGLKLRRPSSRVCTRPTLGTSCRKRPGHAPGRFRLCDPAPAAARLNQAQPVILRKGTDRRRHGRFQPFFPTTRLRRRPRPRAQ